MTAQALVSVTHQRLSIVKRKLALVAAGQPQAREATLLVTSDDSGNIGSMVSTAMPWD
jgi:hypothetical protein